MNTTTKLPLKFNANKPKKPRADFPLYAHATRRWAKRIRGRIHYFGPWADADGALAEYLRVKDYLHLGQEPPPKDGDDGVLTVMKLANAFLTAKQLRVVSGDLSARSFTDYFKTCERVINQFGKYKAVEKLTSADFNSLLAGISKTRGPIATGNEVVRVRSLFHYASAARLLDREVHFGPDFKKPSDKRMREARNDAGLRMFEAAELRKVLKLATTPLDAMILLGVNCGFGNSDVGKLRINALDLSGGWVNFPRPKTAVRRRCKLWPETVTALRRAIASRPAPKDPAHEHLVFITKYGHSWSKSTADNPITKAMSKLLVEAKLTRAGLSFYALRHTTQTVGEETHDAAAVAHIMGHVAGKSDMSARYRERVSDERLERVSCHLHEWLFSSKARKKTSKS